MAVEKRQQLLAFLDFYFGEIDGIWGFKSQSALDSFVRRYGLAADSSEDVIDKALRHAVCYGMPEYDGDWWDEIDFLERSEFRCTCGGRGCNGFPVDPVERLVRNADQTRKHFGKPCIVSSGVRCDLRNSELPGSASNSLHKRGKAMDFCIQGLPSSEVLAYVRTLPEVDEAYAIDSSFVHMGVQEYV